MIVLVVVPHPDDETLGAGGSIRKHIIGGDTVYVVFVTLGEKCYYAHGLGPIPFDFVASLRREEALEAMRILGVPAGNIYFLGFPDMEVMYRIDELVGVFRRLIASLKPNIIYCPHIEDGHRDHRATCIALKQALSIMDLENVLVRYYMIWGETPEGATACELSEDIVSVKRKALMAYSSQIKLLGEEFFIRFASKHEYFVEEKYD